METSSLGETSCRPTALRCMVSGALAGLLVDVSLYPIDSLKTRLQSHRGFAAAGGFRRLYSGIGPMMLGSAPCSSIFFTIYSCSNSSYLLDHHVHSDTLRSSISASLGELFACIVRVPSEVLKQRMQIDSQLHFKRILNETVFSAQRGTLYTGFAITLMREIPFSFIQLPLWEAGKRMFKTRRIKKSSTNDDECCTRCESAFSGFLSGGIAGFLTTPLDVIKTRKMTSHSSCSALSILAEIVKERCLFRGAVARTSWLSIGGALYLEHSHTTTMIMMSNIAHKYGLFVANHKMPVRYRLAYLICLGFLISFGIRCNMSVAVLSMIQNRTSYISSAMTNNGTTITISAPEFYWSPETIGALDSSYFWGYFLTQIPGGYIAAKFPAHKVLLIAFATSSLFNCLIPVAIKTHVIAAMMVRIVQGLAEGVTYPSCHGLWRYWAPPQERSTLATIAFTGSYAGAVLGMPLSGIMTERLSWQLSFYVYGLIGLLWCYAWHIYSSERPSSSYQIDEEEVAYIEESMGTSCSHASKVWLKPPWMQIATSLPVWSINVANFCRSFSFYLLIVGQAFYFKEALGITVGSKGFLAALPHLTMTLVVPLAGYLADSLQAKGLSTTVVRKLMNCGGFGMEALFLLGVAGSKKYGTAIASLTIAYGFSGFAISDIAPRYASLLMGISNGFGSIAGLICPFIAQLMTKKGTKEEWARVFVIASLLHFIGIIFYACFASGRKQPWADYSSDNDLYTIIPSPPPQIHNRILPQIPFSSPSSDDTLIQV